MSKLTTIALVASVTAGAAIAWWLADTNREPSVQNSAVDAKQAAVERVRQRTLRESRPVSKRRQSLRPRRSTQRRKMSQSNRKRWPISRARALRWRRMATRSAPIAVSCNAPRPAVMPPHRLRRIPRGSIQPMHPSRFSGRSGSARGISPLRCCDWLRGQTSRPLSGPWFRWARGSRVFRGSSCVYACLPNTAGWSPSPSSVVCSASAPCRPNSRPRVSGQIEPSLFRI